MDRPGIKAEIERSGSTLAAIARAVDLAPVTLRVSLIYPIPVANRAIANHLNRPVWELWPDWYDKRGNVRPGVSSRIRKALADSRKRRAA